VRSFHLMLLLMLTATSAAICCVKHAARPPTSSPPSGSPAPRTCSDRPIHPRGVTLPIVPQRQEEPNWCTISTMGMLFRYLSVPMSQCEIAGIRTTVDLAKTTTVTINCCNPTARRTVDACTRPTTETDTEYLLRVAGISGIPVHTPLNESYVQQELSNGRPILISYHYTHSFCDAKHWKDIPSICWGHSTLLAGFLQPGVETNTSSVANYLLIDPANGSVEQLTFAELRRGKEIRKEWPWTKGRRIIVPRPWTRSFVRIAQNPSGCVEAFDPLCGCDP
jgi:hypothetical protein